MSCKRCNDMSPDGFDVDRLRKLDEEYLNSAVGSWPFCSQCAGMSAQGIVDLVYKMLRPIPTDALMRELARRFL